MYLPKSKYKIKTASFGEFMLSGSTGKENYVGPYIEDYLGRTFAGTDLTVAEQRVLVPISDEEPVKVFEDVETDLVPKEEDFTSGSYIRYFKQNKVSKVIEEIPKDQVEKDSNIFQFISGSWILTGSLDDVLIYNIPYRGVRWRNQQTLDSWEEKIPGICSVLNLKPEDFVREIK